MDNMTSSQNITAEKPAPTTEQRQAYGTAKTENLRDTGLWRILLPGLVVICCLALIAIPLIILVLLFNNSLQANAAANLAHIPLTWLWIVMAIVEIGIIVIIVRGLVKIFMTPAGNYRNR